MNNKVERHPLISSLIQKFMVALKNYFQYSKTRRSSNTSCSSNEGYYEEAKKAETESRDLEKALKLYIKAIQNREKKDSTIKDFASSLHQLGYTKQAIRFMDDCEYYYDGNKEKYLRLRDNLSVQIKPTGKHQCRLVLLEGIPNELRQIIFEQELKSTLFKVSKRIKSVKYYSNLDLHLSQCTKKDCNNIILQFESYSAAKKTLESFNFQQYFGMDLYWINSKNMRITCLINDGQKDFEESLVIDDQVMKYQRHNLTDQIWVNFGLQIYGDKESNGFINLLAIHLLKQSSKRLQQGQNNKENINQVQILSKNYISYENFCMQYYVNPNQGNNGYRQNNKNRF